MAGSVETLAVLLRMEVVDFLDFPLSLLTAIFTIAMAVLPPYYRERFRRRAALRDHGAAVGRDVAIPMRCVMCGNGHATHPLPVRRFIYGVSPVRKTFDKRFHADYLFHTCLECSRPIRRRRRTGRAILVAGWALLVHMAIGLLVLPPLGLWRPTIKYLGPHHLAWLFSLEAFLIELYLGMVIIGIGFWIAHYSPGVHVIDDGGEKLLFSFRNQHFRDAFAELNGEP